jgi:protease-4
VLAYVVYALRVALWLLGRVLVPPRRAPDYVVFTLDGALPELPPPRPLFPFRRGPAGASVRELAEAFGRIGDDRRVQGIVLLVREPALARGRADALRALIAGLRGKGKRVVVHAAELSSQSLRVAAAADAVLLQEGGHVGPLGAVRGMTFLKDALDRAGIAADVVPSGPYKWPGLLDRTELPEPVRRNLDELLDAEAAALADALAEGRNMTPEAARALIDRGPLTDLEARDAGLVDGLMSEEELPVHLGSAAKPATLVPWPAARRAVRARPPLAPGPYVALVRVQGPIVRGRSRHPPFGATGAAAAVPLVLSARTGDRTVVQAARRVAADRRAAACVVLIDSPGGSATASEAMFQALAALARKKPVVAVMGAVAGSGGYYVAAACREVFAQPGTLTGSIGALWIKLAIGDLLARLGLRRERLTRGAHADMHDSGKRYTPEERALVERAIGRVDAVFRARVAAGRRMTQEAVDGVAGGRLFDGRGALAAGLVDTLGGLVEAADRARALAGLPADAPLTEVQPPTRRPSGPRADPAPLLYLAEGLAALGREGAYTLCPFLWQEGVWQEGISIDGL